jgi:Domain of unknown function (DUF3480)
VEDGLMIQIFSTKMQSVRDALKNMKDADITCGPINNDQKDSEEIVEIKWVDDDVNFNVGVLSPIDNLKLDGIESIRTRLDVTTQNHTKTLRWSEVFLLETNESSVLDDTNYTKLAEPIAKVQPNYDHNKKIYHFLLKGKWKCSPSIFGLNGRKSTKANRHTSDARRKCMLNPF